MYARIEILEGRRLLANGLSTIDIGTTRYFVQIDHDHGVELWKSDLDGSNASLVKDINPGGFNSNPGWFTKLDNKLIFRATSNSGGNDNEPWVSNGTSVGTFRLKDIYSGSSGSAAHDYWVFIGRVLFYANSSWGSPDHLYSTDGTTAGTEDLMGPTPGRTGGLRRFSNLVTVDDHLVYEAEHINPDQTELWQSDGTLAGTEQISGARIISRQLRVYGSNAADAIQLSSNNGVTTVTVVGQTLMTFSDSDYDTILVHALAGDDNVQLDSSITKNANLFGDGGHNTLIGGSGNDALIASGDQNLLHGGAGDDSLYSGTSSKGDTLFGDAGHDLLGEVGSDISDEVHREADDSGVFWSAGRLTIAGNSGDDYLRISQSGGSILLTVGGGNAQFQANSLIVYGFEGNDLIDLRGVKIPTTIFGGAGNDVIYGSNVAERISGGAGNDWINAGGGNDTVYGDAGNDRLFGGNGNDYLNGGAGSDIIRGGAGKDRIFATLNIDDVRGNSGDILAPIQG